MPRRVLLDECLPKKLKRALLNSSVATVQEMGWSGKKNGELMTLARGNFEVFLMSDQNLRYQQNLPYADVAIIVLVAATNRIDDLQPLMPHVNRILPAIKAGEVIEIEA